MKNSSHIIVVIVSLLLSAQLFAASRASDVVSVINPYVRAVPPGQKITAAFLQLANSSDSKHSLVAASSTAADVLELHSHIHENGMMKMRRIDKIEIPAKAKTELKPGTLHIMLIGLKNPLKPGQEVSIILKFADGSEKNITAPVRKIQMPGMIIKNLKL